MRYRLSLGFSQEEVAEKAELSRLAYRNIEAGIASPRLDTLYRIAKALRIPLEELVTPVETLNAVRFRAEGKMNRREQVVVHVTKWLKDYNKLEALLGEKMAFGFESLAKSLLKIERGQRAKKAAHEARAALKLTQDEPIRDICGLLEDNGVKIFPFELASEGFFGLSVGKELGGPAVVVNTWDRITVERWIFSAAHEFGHLLLHLDSFDLNEADEDKNEEAEADQFASFFLMPETVFKSEWEQARGLPFVDRVLKIKRMFHVSYKTILYRVADGNSEIWKRFNYEYKLKYGKSLSKKDEPFKLTTAEFLTDRLDRLVFMALEKKILKDNSAAAILGINNDQLKARFASWNL